ncbi:unnamed protein product [Gongylonema pulchrum]|uniref:beta-N-acetylhexosaminidase n=1 Tax=Gongylonema pulchrum TaxID=637853 RepID=A0A183DVC6_9BILA|nr:unnamed protein product [Gongylonema pulchrum]
MFLRPTSAADVKLFIVKVLHNLTIFVEEGCTSSFPQFGDDESYKLNTTNGGAILKAMQVWGALRGLESFAQLFYDDNTKVREAEIRDYPRFSHRGVLLDTSRHYLSVDILKANIELMAQNKFNTFHWHIVDIESFPYQSKAIPTLILGAYTPRHIYTLEQIKDIVDYARLRGIRVLPEFDTPGIKGLLTKCYDNRGAVIPGMENILDPTSTITWDTLTALFEEVFSTFPDNYVHLGGDEANFWMEPCWLKNPNISQFMKTYGLKDGHGLEVWYFQKLLKLLHSLPSGASKKYLVWQEAIEETEQTKEKIVDNGLVAHIWKSNDKLKYATENGYYAILSACWYLDYISASAEWITYYLCDPQVSNCFYCYCPYRGAMNISFVDEPFFADSHLFPFERETRSTLRSGFHSSILLELRSVFE